jgi:hypothetical protein
MTLRDFIKENRAEIDAAITRAVSHVPRQAGCDCSKQGTDHYHTNKVRIDNAERRAWILNDEGLYRWARSEGVRI